MRTLPARAATTAVVVSVLLVRRSRGLVPSSSAFFRAARTLNYSPQTTRSMDATKPGESRGSPPPPALSAALGAAVTIPPEARSAVPGSKEIEEQRRPMRNPIGPNSRVLIVGGNRGIGLEFVRQCADRGALVVATHRGIDVPPELSDVIDMYEGRVSALTMDVSDADSVERAASELKSRDGDDDDGGDDCVLPLTHVIHSAGTYPTTGTSFDGTARGTRASAPPVTADIMIETFQVNAVGPLIVAQAFVPLMGRREGGRSVDGDDDDDDDDGNGRVIPLPVLAVLSSKVGSVHDNGSGGAYAYRASKSALNCICKSLSVDLAGQVSMVLLHPGYVRTEMTGMNGLIDADESVEGMLRAVESTDSTVGFRWVDYKAELIPW